MSETTANAQPKRTPRRKLVGRVVSDSMQNTIVVKVERRMPHPLYLKIVTQSKKVMAHNPEDRAKLGDKVEIVETRPMSRRKRFKVQRILVTAQKEAS